MDADMNSSVVFLRASDDNSDEVTQTAMDAEAELDAHAATTQSEGADDRPGDERCRALQQEVNRLRSYLGKDVQQLQAELESYRGQLAELRRHMDAKQSIIQLQERALADSGGVLSADDATAEAWARQRETEGDETGRMVLTSGGDRALCMLQRWRQKVFEQMVQAMAAEEAAREQDRRHRRTIDRLSKQHQTDLLRIAQQTQRIDELEASCRHASAENQDLKQQLSRNYAAHTSYSNMQRWADQQAEALKTLCQQASSNFDRQSKAVLVHAQKLQILGDRVSFARRRIDMVRTVMETHQTQQCGGGSRGDKEGEGGLLTGRHEDDDSSEHPDESGTLEELLSSYRQEIDRLTEERDRLASQLVQHQRSIDQFRNDVRKEVAGEVESLKVSLEAASSSAHQAEEARLQLEQDNAELKEKLEAARQESSSLLAEAEEAAKGMAKELEEKYKSRLDAQQQELIEKENLLQALRDDLAQTQGELRAAQTRHRREVEATEHQHQRRMQSLQSNLFEAENQLRMVTKERNMLAATLRSFNTNQAAPRAAGEPEPFRGSLPARPSSEPQPSFKASLDLSPPLPSRFSRESSITNPAQPGMAHRDHTKRNAARQHVVAAESALGGQQSYVERRRDVSLPAVASSSLPLDLGDLTPHSAWHHGSETSTPVRSEINDSDSNPEGNQEDEEAHPERASSNASSLSASLLDLLQMPKGTADKQSFGGAEEVDAYRDGSGPKDGQAQEKRNPSGTWSSSASSVASLEAHELLSQIADLARTVLSPEPGKVVNTPREIVD